MPGELPSEFNFFFLSVGVYLFERVREAGSIHLLVSLSVAKSGSEPKQVAGNTIQVLHGLGRNLRTCTLTTAPRACTSGELESWILK